MSWEDASLHGGLLLLLAFEGVPSEGTFLPRLESKRTEPTSKKVIETDTAFISGSSRIGGFALSYICQRGFQEDHG